jgi:hypothetical protein
MKELADALEIRAGEFSERAMAEMYEDPFWDARFGERGRRFSGEDGRYHVRYLVEALRAGTPETLTQYARWLQSVLTTRGMCSRHLAENFERLARIIRDSVEGAELAVAYLRAAEEALLYPGGPAREVQDASGAVAALVAQKEPESSPAREGRPGGAGQADDPRTVLSYLADAMALGRPEIFVDHLAWLASFLAQRGAQRDRLTRTLSAMEEALEVLPPAAREEALGLVAAATLRIRERPA